MIRSSGDVSSQLACSNIPQPDLKNDSGEKAAQQESYRNIPLSKNDSSEKVPPQESHANLRISTNDNSEKAPPPDSNINPDLVGLAAASAATAGLAIVGAPVAVVAGVGMAVWFLIRSVLSSG